MYTESMKIFVKPKPNEKFYRLPAAEAAHTAMQVARQYGNDGQPDWQIFRDWTAAHKQRNRAGRQLSLA